MGILLNSPNSPNLTISLNSGDYLSLTFKLELTFAFALSLALKLALGATLGKKSQRIY